MRVSFFRIGALTIALSAMANSVFATNPTNTGYMGPQGSQNSTNPSTTGTNTPSPVTDNNWMPPPPPSQNSTTGTDSTNPIDSQITNYPADATPPGGDDSDVGGMWGPNGQPGTSKGNMPPPPSQDNVWQDNGMNPGQGGMNSTPNGQDGPGMGGPGNPPPGGPGMGRPGSPPPGGPGMGGPGMNGPQGGQGPGGNTGSANGTSSKAPVKKSAPNAQKTKTQKQAKSN